MRLNAEQRSKVEADKRKVLDQIDQYIKDKKDAEDYNHTATIEHDKAVEDDKKRLQDAQTRNLKIAQDNAQAQSDYLRRLQEVRDQNADTLKKHRDAIARIRQQQDDDEREYQAEVNRVNAENNKRIAAYQKALADVRAATQANQDHLTSAGSQNASAVSATVRAQLDAFNKAMATNQQRMADYARDVERVNAANKLLDDQYLAAKRIVDAKNQQSRQEADADNQRKNAAYQRKLQEWQATARQAEADRQHNLDEYGQQYNNVVAENNRIIAQNKRAVENWEQQVRQVRQQNLQIDEQNRQAQVRYQQLTAQYQRDVVNIQNAPVFASSGTASIRGNYNTGASGGASYFDNFALFDPSYTGESLIAPITYNSDTRIYNVQGGDLSLDPDGVSWKLDNISNGSSFYMSNVSTSSSGERVHMKVTFVDLGRLRHRNFDHHYAWVARDGDSFGMSKPETDL